MDKNTYSPQISPGNSFLTPPPAIGPLFVKSSTITLTHPVVSPTTTLTLRAPELGNRESLRLRRINRTTRGNSLRIFNDRDWPRDHILTISISGLEKDEVDALIAFVNASLGKDIGYLDYESRQWVGIITNPKAVVTDLTKSCNFSAEIEFMGEVV